MKDYNHQEIELKWQKIKEDSKAYKTSDDSSKEKFYALIEFPYPSGNGLHVGHLRPYTALDIVARKKRREGKNVLFPMGWDAFGLPTENYAIKNKIHPKKVTEQNIARFKSQLQRVGYSFDWDREVNTTDPDYYKWTQWIFLKLFEKGLAYKKEMPINWCTSCKVGLANEEVVNGLCERCGSDVVQRNKKQWMLKITAYADKLIDGLKELDFIERAKVQQINWIGRSEGASVDFKLENSDQALTIFTTRPDTIFGATYMVLAPEHALLTEMADKIENKDEVQAYVDQARRKSDFERQENAKDKTGVEVKGIRAINPATGKSIPIWISDYVLISYGTGAIMAVPAHDTRDWEFAKKFDLPIVEVIQGGDVDKEAFTDTDKGKLVNSGRFDGMEVKEAIEKIIAWIEDSKLGHKEINFKLRDWVFSRQRYWGEPIPLVYCEKCGWVPVPESELPITLPDIENYEPGPNGESPLADVHEWVKTKCPACGGDAERETDTMPQWAGSSWYFLRYIDPYNNEAIADPEKLKKWCPVDWYNGGMEHTTLHLLYSRFWHKFLYDIGVVPTPEPYQKRTSHGMILGETHEKMSKSRGNVVNPDEIIAEVGADSVRTYEMFIGDFEKEVPWSTNGLKGCKKFIDRVWRLTGMLNDNSGISDDMVSLIHTTIKKVSLDIERMKFNTAIARLMELTNAFYNKKAVQKEELKMLLTLLNPFAPHMTEEMWSEYFEGTIDDQPWPTWDESLLASDEVDLVIQVGGKTRGVIKAAPDATEEAVEAAIAADPNLAKHVEGKERIKVIYVKGKIYNILIRK